VTDSEQNLKVLSEHVRRLATEQQAAAGRITVANQAAQNVAGSLWSTHGVVCAPTNIAMSTAETARKAAGAVLWKVSTELSEKLTNAADNYDNVDSQEGQDIGACGL
jgi:Excreted virulence factor EspC, type VII ESX diderm